MHTTSAIHTSHTDSIDSSPRADPSSRWPASASAPLDSRKIADLGDGRELFRLRSTAPAFERDVLALRSMVYGRPAAACRDAIDDDSDHYVSYQNGIPAYAARVTRASAAPIECERHDPRQHVERFRDRLLSCGRFVRNPNLPGGFQRATEFIAACWADLVAQGVRVEISGAIERLLPHYRALGHIPLRMPTFLHPVRGVVSYTICFIADRLLPGSVNARLPVVADPMPASAGVLSFSAGADSPRCSRRRPRRYRRRRSLRAR